MSSKNYRVESSGSPSPSPIDASSGLEADQDFTIEVSMKYYQRKTECLSEWQKNELKALSGWLEKIRLKTVQQVKSNPNDCHAHAGGKFTKGFVLPKEVSHERQLYGLKASGKARVHGFFVDQKFFVVWLDRNHRLHN